MGCKRGHSFAILSSEPILGSGSKVCFGAFRVAKIGCGCVIGCETNKISAGWSVARRVETQLPKPHEISQQHAERRRAL
jgi:hypothetical protein